MQLLRIKSLFCTLIVITSAQVSLAATYHVSPFGSNTPPYDTYAHAAHRIVDAATLASTAGDTVLVHAGSYTSTDTVRIALGVTFAGVGRDSVTIYWGDTEHRPGRMVSLAGGNEVYGIEFAYPKESVFNDAITGLHAFTAQPIVFRDCRLTDVKVYFDGETQFEVVRNEFNYTLFVALFVGGRHCWVHENLFKVVGSNGPGNGIWAWLADTVIIENNRFLADVDEYDNPFAVEIEECDTAVVRNNLIVNTKAAIIWSETDGLIESNTMVHSDPDWFASLEVFQTKTDHVTIRNNVFVDMERPIAWGPQGGVDTAGLTTFVHNTFWPPRDTLYKTYPPGVSPLRFPLVESLNVFAYPMFENESTYCPQVGSPLIDLGDPALSDVDLTRSDIGWHGGPGGITYEYLDLPPLAPETVSVSGEDTLITVVWSKRPETDLSGYRLYRGYTPGFWISGLNPFAEFGPDVIDTSLQLSRNHDSVYFVVTAFDLSGQESPTSEEREWIITSHPFNRPPYWFEIVDQEVIEGDSLVLSVSASDPDGDSLTLMADGLPPNALFVDYANNQGSLAFGPDSTQAGEYEIEFVASDGELSDTELVSITVTDQIANSQAPGIRMVYPNPATDLITVRLLVPAAGGEMVSVRLVLHDIVGRTIATCFEESLPRGDHQVQFNLDDSSFPVDLSSGVYLLRMQSGEKTVGEFAKIALIR